MLETRVDPRIVRTRVALRDALAALLRERKFEALSLVEIAEKAGLYRGTIYKHYADKFALLDAWIADDLQQRLLVATHGGACGEGMNERMLAAIISAACESQRWVSTLGDGNDRLLHPIAEARLRRLLLRVVEFALDEKVLLPVERRELAAGMASAAIHGAALVWAKGKSASPRAWTAHLASVLTSLATTVVPNPKTVRLTRELHFEDEDARRV